jgi:CheY-like chemotaxis protein
MYAPHNQRVMFVDDEEGVRLSWNRFLTERGFAVTTAEDGAKAISRLRKEPVDVVVADLRMPGVDGLQLLEWMHESQPETRFILLTGYGNEEVERKARELGAYEYLNKPISPEALSAIITAATQLKLIAEPKAAAAAAVAPEAIKTIDLGPIVEVTQPGSVRTTIKFATRLVMAPVIGLAFVLFLPILGFALFFRVLAEAIAKARAERIQP